MNLLNNVVIFTPKKLNVFIYLTHTHTHIESNKMEKESHCSLVKHVILSKLWAEKTAPYYFCNNFEKSFLYCNNNWCTYTLINLEQNDIKSSISFEACLYSNLWNAASLHTCYDQPRFCHVSLKVVIIISNIYMKHHIKCENVWTNNTLQ